MAVEQVELQIGLERCLAEPPRVMHRGRLGLLMNQASVDRQFRYAHDLLLSHFPGQLTTLFSPQHGLWGEQQANMIESDHTLDSRTQLPVYSLYSETRCPTAEMLAAIDCLLIDLQDVGTRVYTFIWTMLECLQACAQAGKVVVVLDRPNPLGGEIVEGPVLQAGFESFVGNAGLPMRHGLTIGELARLFVHEFKIDVELHIVAMRGWQGSGLVYDFNRPWIWPSPNMPRPETALLYPGQVLLEGANLSEGRGTTRPFELIGAPFLDGYRWLDALNGWTLPGIELLPTRFTPTFDKWCGSSCGGLDLRIIDPQQVRSTQATLALLATAFQLAPDECEWLDPPYEYEYEKPPIDILFGGPQLRQALTRPDELTAGTITELLKIDRTAYLQRCQPHWLYARVE